MEKGCGAGRTGAFVRRAKRLACQEWDSNLHLQERLGPECSTLDYYTCSAILKGLSQGQMAHKLKNQIQILSQIHSAFKNFYLSYLID